MRWRPEGWKNPWPVIDIVKEQIFEEGADAMLKALKDAEIGSVPKEPASNPVLTVHNRHACCSGKAPELKSSPRLYTAYFENEHRDQLVFQYDEETEEGRLWHGDWNWEHSFLIKDGTCPGMILDHSEAAWLLLVWLTSHRAQK